MAVPTFSFVDKMIIFVALCCISAVTSLETRDIFVTRDTYLDSNNVRRNYGSSNSILVGQSTATGALARGLLWFDLVSVIPVGSTLISAQLRMPQTSGTTTKCTSSSPSTTCPTIHLMSTEWGEGTGPTCSSCSLPSGHSAWFVSAQPTGWKVQGGDYSLQELACENPDQDDGFSYWDLNTHQLQSIVDDPTRNFGFMLRMDDGSAIRSFQSRDSTATGIRLQVNLEPLGTATTSMAPTVAPKENDVVVRDVFVSRDTFVDSEDFRNFGGSTELRVGLGGSFPTTLARGLIWFDLETVVPPADSEFNLVGAQLRMGVSSDSSVSGCATFNPSACATIHAPLAIWGEGGGPSCSSCSVPDGQTTWFYSSKPSLWKVPGVDFNRTNVVATESTEMQAEGNSFAFWDLDVPYVMSIMADPTKNFGFLIRSDDRPVRSFRTRGSIATATRLRLTYERNGTPPPQNEKLSDPQVRDLFVSRDTYLSSDDFRNFGSSSDIMVGLGGDASGVALSRGLIRFDIESLVPPGSRVVSAQVRLMISTNTFNVKCRTTTPVACATLHLPLKIWGEGTGPSCSSCSLPSDESSWFFSARPTAWDIPGGDFDRSPIATEVPSDDDRFSLWNLDVAKFQEIVDDPSRNVGFLILSDESAVRSYRARRTLATATRLQVTFDLPGSSANTPIVSPSPLPSPPAGPVMRDVYISRDTYISSGDRRNFGSQSTFNVGLGEDSVTLTRGLLRFDIEKLVPPGSTLTKATLRLEITSSSVQRPDCSASNPSSCGTLHLVSKPWGEGDGPSCSSCSIRDGQTTWTFSAEPETWTVPGGDFEFDPLATETFLTEQDRFAFWDLDIGKLQPLLDDPSKNLGFLLRADDSLVRSFRARRNIATSARLRLFFQPEGTTPSPVVAPTPSEPTKPSTPSPVVAPTPSGPTNPVTSSPIVAPTPSGSVDESPTAMGIQPTLSPTPAESRIECKTFQVDLSMRGAFTPALQDLFEDATAGLSENYLPNSANVVTTVQILAVTSIDQDDGTTLYAVTFSICFESTVDVLSFVDEFEAYMASPSNRQMFEQVLVSMNFPEATVTEATPVSTTREGGGSSSSGSIGIIIGSVGAALVLVGGGGYLLVRRKRRQRGTSDREDEGTTTAGGLSSKPTEREVAANFGEPVGEEPAIAHAAVMRVADDVEEGSFQLDYKHQGQSVNEPSYMRDSASSSTPSSVQK